MPSCVASRRRKCWPRSSRRSRCRRRTWSRASGGEWRFSPSMRLPRLPLVTALALLFFFAYITGIRLAYSLLYALVLIFVVSYFWSRLAADNLSIRRSSPEGQYQVGDNFEEQFTIENRSWIPIPLIELTDFSNLPGYDPDRKSTRLNSSHSQISYAVFCLQKTQ